MIPLRVGAVVLAIVGGLLFSQTASVFAFQSFTRTPRAAIPIHKLNALSNHDAVPPVGDESRRKALGIFAATLPAFWMVQSVPSNAATKIKPDDAFAALVKAREELKVAGEKYLSKRDYYGLRTYLYEEAINLNSYETNAGALLESKRLDAESKKDIGTIRRYGVGADVIIMFGGLKAEIDEENENPNYSDVAKYLKRTEDSLDEVIAICRSNGF